MHDYSRDTGSPLSRKLALLRHPLLCAYSLLRKNPPVWNLLNKEGKALYKDRPPRLDATQRKVLGDLTQNGISFTHLDDLFPGRNLLSDLIDESNLRQKDAKDGEKKAFQKYALTQGSVIDLESPFNRLSLEPRILDIANSYLSLCSKLVYFELAITNLMDPGAQPSGSQRWHRDPALNSLAKMFVYLTDIDEMSGPFTYVVQSHKRGRWGQIFPQKQFGRHGYYPPDGAVEKAVPESDIKVCTGRAGTVIFCDTTGLHKGGYALSKPRIMYTSVYMAEGEIIKPLFKRPPNLKEQIGALDAVARFAVDE